MRAISAGAILVLSLAVGGCGDADDEPGADSGASSSATSQLTVESVVPTTLSPEPSNAPSSSEPAWNLPKGYPKVVKVSTLPFQVRSWYEMSGTKRAVAVAPGVWAEVGPGSSMEDAISAGIFDGFCSSKAAFERKWLAGEETAGTCW